MLEKLLAGKNQCVWNRALSNEWGRLAQGNQYGVTAQDAIDFISKQQVPKHKKITYAQFVCDH